MNAVTNFILVSCLYAAVFSLSFMKVEAAQPHTIGRSDATSWTKENPNSFVATFPNTVCTLIPSSSNQLLDYVSEELMADYTYVNLAGGTDAVEGSFIISANHVGKPDMLRASGVKNVFGVLDKSGGGSFYACVYHEPCLEAEDFDTPTLEDIYVDWILFSGTFTSNSDTHVRTIDFDGMYYGGITCKSTSGGNDNMAAVILTALTEEMMVTSEFALWVDRISYENYITACIALPNPEGRDRAYDLFTVVAVTIENGVNSVHEKRPLPGQYYIEYDSMFMDHFEDGSHVICVDKPFASPLSSVPYVFVTPTLRSKVSDSTSEAPVPDPPITAWVEYVSEAGFRGCVARPYYAGEILPNASIPFLDYLVISVDGILGAESVDDIPFIMEFELVNLEVTDMVQAYEASSEEVFEDFIDDAINTRWDWYLLEIGYVYNLEANRIAFVLQHKERISNTGGARIEMDKLKRWAASQQGRFPFDDSSYPERLSEILYPNGNPGPAGWHKMTLSEAAPCIYEPYSEGDCSVETCDGVAIGSKTITRQPSNPGDPNCGTQTMDVPCNMFPCAPLKEKIVTFPLSDYCKAGGDLTWLWVVLGIVAAIVVIAGAYFVVRSRRMADVGKISDV